MNRFVSMVSDVFKCEWLCTKWLCSPKIYLVLEKTLESPLHCKIKPVNLKEFNPEYPLGGLMLKLQYVGHLIWRADSLEKSLTLGKTGGKRWRGQQRMRWWDSITGSMDENLSKFWEIRRTEEPGVLQSMVLRRVRYDRATEQQEQQKCMCWSHKSKCDRTWRRSLSGSKVNWSHKGPEVEGVADLTGLQICAS